MLGKSHHSLLLDPLLIAALIKQTASAPTQAGQHVPRLVQEYPHATYGGNLHSLPERVRDTLSFENKSRSNVSGWMHQWLYGYNGCGQSMGRDAKAHIDDAYDAAWHLTSREGVYRSIDWISAAAVEYFGPPINNFEYQERIQGVFDKTTDAIWVQRPSQDLTYIHVRCDDPQRRCNKCPQLRDSDKWSPAYAMQQDPEDGFPMINFCNPFFTKHTMRESLVWGQGIPQPFNSTPAAYDNTGRIFLHQLLHLDNLLQNYPANHLQDLALDYKTGQGKRTQAFASDVGSVKILAQLQYAPSTPPFPKAGYYTSRNADSLAWFALARWVQDEIQVYPHLPQVVPEPAGLPYPELHPPLFLVFKNDSDPMFTFTNGSWSSRNIEDCSMDVDGWITSDLLISINGMANDSAYPPEYLASKASWLKNARLTATPPPPSRTLTTSSTASSTSTTPSSHPTGGNMPEVLCGTWYEGTMDHFEIRGRDKSWDQKKLGPWGKGLYDNLIGCGAISVWTFERTPDDPNYDWLARGYMAIGSKKCIGHAVVGAGGKTPDGCVGVGKV